MYISTHQGRAHLGVRAPPQYHPPGVVWLDDLELGMGMDGSIGNLHLVMTLPVCHGKIHHAFKNGKPTVFRLGPSTNHGYVSHNQKVYLLWFIN